MSDAVSFVDIKAYAAPSVWTAETMAANRDEWVIHLSASDISELERALAHAKAAGKGVPEMTKEDFPLAALEDKLVDIRRRIETGMGVMLLRGLPVERYSKADAGTIYWGIGRYLGRPIAQNAFGDVLGHVWDLGKDPRTDASARGYQSKLGLPFHTDGADVVGLLCLQTAKSGGLSSIASSVAIHNAMLESRPDLLARLYRPFPLDRRNEQSGSHAPFTMAPKFGWGGERLFNCYNRSYVESSQRFPDAPRLTAEDREAFDLFDSFSRSERFRVDMQLERGDMQFINNFTVVHSRTEYEDHPERERKRHLLRLWLMTPGMSDVPAAFRERLRITEEWSKSPRAPIYDVNDIMGVTTH